MKAILTEGNILEQEDRLYNAIKECNISVLEELLHNDLLFIFPVDK